MRKRWQRRRRMGTESDARFTLHASRFSPSLREDRRDTPFGLPARRACAFGFASMPGRG